MKKLLLLSTLLFLAGCAPNMVAVGTNAKFTNKGSDTNTFDSLNFTAFWNLKK